MYFGHENVGGYIGKDHFSNAGFLAGYNVFFIEIIHPTLAFRRNCIFRPVILDQIMIPCLTELNLLVVSNGIFLWVCFFSIVKNYWL